MANSVSHFALLGTAILIMSTSGTLGRYIDLSPPLIIWIRCVIGTIALFALLKVRKSTFSFGNQKQFLILLLSSVLLGIHWVTYFYALHLSSVAVGMLALFSYPVITSLLEPVMLKTPFQRGSIILGLIGFIGVGLLAPEMNLENDYTLGIIIAIFSAIAYSLRNILLKTRVSDQSGLSLMYYQLLINSIILAPAAFVVDYQPIEVFDQWFPLLILGLLTTATGHTLFVMSFRHFSVSTVSIISTLTPLIGAFLGFIVLGEVPEGRTLLGGSLIFVTVFLESYRTTRYYR